MASTLKPFTPSLDPPPRNTWEEDNLLRLVPVIIDSLDAILAERDRPALCEDLWGIRAGLSAHYEGMASLLLKPEDGTGDVLDGDDQDLDRLAGLLALGAAACTASLRMTDWEAEVKAIRWTLRLGQRLLAAEQLAGGKGGRP